MYFRFDMKYSHTLDASVLEHSLKKINNPISCNFSFSFYQSSMNSVFKTDQQSINNQLLVPAWWRMMKMSVRGKIAKHE
jgi:hypothetical protein